VKKSINLISIIVILLSLINGQIVVTLAQSTQATGKIESAWISPNVLTTYTDGIPTNSLIYSTQQVIWDGSKYVEYIFRSISDNQFSVQCPRVGVLLTSSGIRIFNANMTKEAATQAIWELWKIEKDGPTKLDVKSHTFTYETFSDSVRVVESQLMMDGSVLGITYDFANIAKCSINFRAAEKATYRIVWHVEAPRATNHEIKGLATKEDKVVDCSVNFFTESQFLLQLGWEDALYYFSSVTVEQYDSGRKADIIFAEREFNAGEALSFDPTFYSEASIDGGITRQGQTYPPTSGSAVTTYTTEEVGQMGSTGYYYINRIYVSFDTSLIPDGATVTSANLYMKTTSTDGSVTDFYVKVYGGTQPIYGSSLETGDWGCGTSYQSQWYTSNWQANTWISWSISTSQVNKQGRTQFELKSSREGTAPTGSEYISLYMADSDYDPYLSLSYTFIFTNRWAVIVCGGGRLENQQEDFENEIDETYRTLLSLGFTSTSIYYLNVITPRDANGDGINDVDAYASKTNVQSAITSWLKSKSGSNDLCFIYLVNHGMDGGYFFLDSNNNGYINITDPNEYIRPNELDSWLDQVTYNVLFCTIEACFSGDFIPNLSQTNRIIVTSCDGDHPAYPDPGTDWPAFSHTFIPQLIGHTVGNAFNTAYTHVETVVPSYYGDHQYPLLDDNGDGVGHRGSLPNGNDGTWYALIIQLG